MNLKLSKGIVFVVIGVLFLFVTFHTVKDNLGTQEWGARTFWNELYIFKNNFNLNSFVKPNILNFVFSILFFALGGIELFEYSK